MKKTSLILVATFCLQGIFSQEISKENKTPEKKLNEKEIVKKPELTANEKYAVKMLKSGYKIKSIMLQTKLTKQRIKELRKENL